MGPSNNVLNAPWRRVPANISLGFHLSRNTGEISRVMNNGLRGLREFVFDPIFLILPFGVKFCLSPATCWFVWILYSPLFYW